MPDDLLYSITAAVKYFDAEGIEIPYDMRMSARRYGAIKAGESLPEINSQYHDAITQALIGYFESSGRITAPRNAFRRGMVDAFGAAFDLGWTDGGREMPPDANALEWFNARVEQEFGFIDTLFTQAKELRAEESADWFGWATKKADGYTNTLRTIYNMGKLYALQNKMLTFEGTDGDANHICQSINGT